MNAQPEFQQFDVLGAVQECCARHGIAEGTFGKKAVNDWSFVTTLRAGRYPRPETIERVLKFIRECDAAPPPPAEDVPLAT